MSTESVSGSPTSGSASQPTWQATVIGVAIIALVGAIFIVVFAKSGTDAALKVFGALGLLVGLITGAIPTYFFQQRSVQAAQDSANATAQSARSDAQATVKAARAGEEKSRVAADNARKQKDQADARYAVLAGAAPPEVVAQVKGAHADLFANMGLPADGGSSR